MKQNGYEKEVWPLALRTAVAGTKLETMKSFYVDDCLISLPSTEDADVFKETSIALMANAGMELRKWRGNSIASNDNTADKALGIC